MPIEEFWVVPHLSSAIDSLASRSLAVDVGANRGSWTSDLASLFDRVIAIEPDERASNFIERSARVTVVQAVANSESGEATLYLRGSPDQNSLLKVHPIGGNSCAEVPPVGESRVRCVTLDELCPEGADLVKIDVEGTEADVLRGCSDDGRWSRTVFVVECHDTRDAVCVELNRLGKSMKFIPHVYQSHPGHCWVVT